jgi:hypothetical protein
MPQASPSPSKPSLPDNVITSGKEIREIKILAETQGEMIKNQQIKIQRITELLEKQSGQLQTLLAANLTREAKVTANNILSSFGP